MAKEKLEKKKGWLNKAEMSASLGISVQAFDKWGVAPVARIGREAFYTAEHVLNNRLDNFRSKQQPNDGIDPLAEARLTQERVRLTASQADAQEMKNKITERQAVPVGFAIYALSKIAARIGARLDTIPLQLKRKHPDLSAIQVESLQREIAITRNASAELDKELPALINEYFNNLEG